MYTRLLYQNLTDRIPLNSCVHLLFDDCLVAKKLLIHFSSWLQSEIPDVEGMVADNMEPEPVLVASNPEEETQGSSQTSNPSPEQDEEQAGLEKPSK